MAPSTARCSWSAQIAQPSASSPGASRASQSMSWPMVQVRDGSGRASPWPARGGPVAAAAVTEADRLWVVGARAFEDGLYDIAFRELGRFAELAPADPRRGDATFLRGKSAYALGRHAEALAEFQAAERYPLQAITPGEPLFWRGETLFRLKRMEEASTQYASFLRGYPQSIY